MTGHEQFAEDLTLYVLGTLDGPERGELERHLEGCAACIREMEQLQGEFGLVGLAAIEPAPPRRTRARLLKAIAKEPRDDAASHPARPWWWTVAPLAAATSHSRLRVSRFG